MDPLAARFSGRRWADFAGAAVSGGLTWSVARGQREHVCVQRLDLYAMSLP